MPGLTDVLPDAVRSAVAIAAGGGVGWLAIKAIRAVTPARRQEERR
jgi:hypothetical protein